MGCCCLGATAARFAMKFGRTSCDRTGDTHILSIEVDSIVDSFIFVGETIAIRACEGHPSRGSFTTYLSYESGSRYMT